MSLADNDDMARGLGVDARLRALERRAKEGDPWAELRAAALRVHLVPRRRPERLKAKATHIRWHGQYPFDHTYDEVIASDRVWATQELEKRWVRFYLAANGTERLRLREDWIVGLGKPGRRFFGYERDRHG